MQAQNVENAGRFGNFFWKAIAAGRLAGRPSERDAYMGTEGCSASAGAFQGVRFHWPHTIRVYFVLSPKFLGTCYWCAIKIFVLFFAISAGRRKSQKTKPGPAPTGSASANCVQAQNVENTKRFGIFFESLSLCGWWVVVVGPGERDAYMGAEGCSASASANCVHAQNVENTMRFGILFASLLCVTCGPAVCG